jgi:inner membrane protein
MDSLTQIALGSAVTALIAPARHRRAALVAGGVLGTLPDLDVIPITLSGADAVSRITWHRGPSHSLLLLAVTGWLLWACTAPLVGSWVGP